MTMTRMQILLGAVLAFVWICPLQAQRGTTYPSAPVRVVVGFPPGGGVDVVARLIAQKMAGVWGQPVVVENRPGAASVLATRLVAGAAPDGYTVLINSNTMVVNQVGNPNAGYDIERQLIPILNVAWQPSILADLTLPPAVPHVRAGKVKAIAVTSAKRASTLPEVPTVAESGFPGYEVNVFSGFFMPAGAPKPVVDRFHEAVLKVMAMADIKEQLATLGFEPADTSGDEFRRLVSDEVKKWAKVLEAANIKFE